MLHRRSAPHTRLGHAVRRRRKQLNLTLKDAAVRTGFHRNYLGAIELGDCNPTYETLMRLAAGYDVPLARLIGDAQPPADRNRDLVDPVLVDGAPAMAVADEGSEGRDEPTSAVGWNR